MAIKTLHAVELERSLEDVFGEAHTLGELNHPAIIGVTDCSYADQERQARPYIVMPYFAGGSLEVHLRQHGPLPAKQADGGGAAGGCGDAGGSRARHLPPRSEAGQRAGTPGRRCWQVKVIDFGLALRKQVIETSMAGRAAGQTILGDSVAGTLKYAPPEQLGELRDAAGRPVPVGPYSDVYAFGELCCFALFKTTEPKRRHWDLVAGSWPSCWKNAPRRSEHRHRKSSGTGRIGIAGLRPENAGGRGKTAGGRATAC